MAHIRKFANLIYLRNKATERCTEEGKEQYTKEIKGEPKCYANWLGNGKEMDSGCLILKKEEYNEMLKDRFTLRSGYKMNPKTLINYGYEEIQPTEICSPERSHVGYFEGLWERNANC